MLENNPTLIDEYQKEAEKNAKQKSSKSESKKVKENRF